MVKHIILDTDIGGDVDDLFALLLALNSSEFVIDLIVTNDEVKFKRAKYLLRVLKLLDKTIPVVSGIDLSHNTEDSCFSANKEVDIYEKYDLETNFITSIQNLVKKNKYTYYICLGAQSNLAKFISHAEHLKDKTEIFIMGGSLNRSKSKPGHNIIRDIDAARQVFNSNWNKKYVLGDVTHENEIKIDKTHPLLKRLSDKNNSISSFITNAITDFLDTYHNQHFWLHDPLTVSGLLNENIISFTKRKIAMSNNGVMYLENTGKETLVSTSVDFNLFWETFNKRMLT